MEVLLLLIGLLVALWWLHLWMFPGLMGVVARMLRWTVRQAVYVGWSVPRRRLGVGKTLWLWAVVTAVLVTLGALTQGNNGLSVGHRVIGVLEIWFLVFAAWWVLRWWARRAFRPRDLPQRRR